mmetsp:Transcript_46692/g.109319  ORF Transcript_46692/g.109319 Transcript_46692/m.109319 type:complete len:216 (-) Transcript_46692:281-928(-)
MKRISGTAPAHDGVDCPRLPQQNVSHVPHVLQEPVGPSRHFVQPHSGIDGNRVTRYHNVCVQVVIPPYDGFQLEAHVHDDHICVQPHQVVATRIAAQDVLGRPDLQPGRVAGFVHFACQDVKIIAIPPGVLAHHCKGALHVALQYRRNHDGLHAHPRLGIWVGETVDHPRSGIERSVGHIPSLEGIVGICPMGSPVAGRKWGLHICCRKRRDRNM